MRSTSADGGPRRGWLGAVVAISLGIVAVGTGIGFAAQNQDQSAQQVKTCDATLVSGGGTTASGEKSDPKSLTAGSSVFPLGSKVKVTNPATDKSVTVRINDKNSFCVAMTPACLICFDAKSTLSSIALPPVSLFHLAVPASSHGIM